MWKWNDFWALKIVCQKGFEGWIKRLNIYCKWNFVWGLLTRKVPCKLFWIELIKVFLKDVICFRMVLPPHSAVGSAAQFTRCSFSWITSTICWMFQGFFPHSSISLIQEVWVPHFSTRIQGYDCKARQNKYTDPGSTGFRLRTLGIHVQWNCKHLRYRCNFNIYFISTLSVNTQYIQLLWIAVTKILPKLG